MQNQILGQLDGVEYFIDVAIAASGSNLRFGGEDAHAEVLFLPKPMTGEYKLVFHGQTDTNLKADIHLFSINGEPLHEMVEKKIPSSGEIAYLIKVGDGCNIELVEVVEEEGPSFNRLREKIKYSYEQKWIKKKQVFWLLTESIDRIEKEYGKKPHKTVPSLRVLKILVKTFSHNLFTKNGASYIIDEIDLLIGFLK